MILPRHFLANLMKKGFSHILFLIIFLFGYNYCFGEDVSSFNLIGLRIGLWGMSSADIESRIPEYQASSKTVSPYGEVFFTYGLKNGFLGELSLGSCDRGETRFELGNDYYWESVVIYPISLGGYFYPLSHKPQTPWQPYLDLGVSYVVGSKSLDYGSVYPGYRYFFEGYVKTRAAFGVFAGTGLDFNLSKYLILNFDAKYRWVKFGEEVGGIKDYSGYQLTLGFAYVLGINR